MSVINEFALEWLTALLPEFYAKYPHIALQVDISPHKADLFTSDVDMVVRAGMPNESNLIVKYLTNVNFFFALPKLTLITLVHQAHLMS